MGDWTNIAFGSIYFALRKLAEEGFIEQAATEREGGRPSRSVYRITVAGKKEFLRLLREIWRGMERQYFSIDVGLAFSDALPVEEVKGYLLARIVSLESILESLQTHGAEQLSRNKVPRSAASVFEHSRLHFHAELSWTRGVLAEMEKGALP
jgi:DNA-binding PadR family transcriptional regulator